MKSVLSGSSMAVMAMGSLAALSVGNLLAADAAAPAPEEKKPKWETSAGLGLTLTSGNSESVAFSANALTLYKWEENEFGAAASMGYGEATPRKTETDQDPDSEKNTHYIKGGLQYNRLFNERLYGYARGDALYDSIAAVDYRFNLSPGGGYYFSKQPKFTLSGELGPGYVFEKVAGNEADYLSLRVGERLEWKFSGTARLWQSLGWVPEVNDFENFILNFELGVGAALTKKLELQVVLSDIYDNQPGVYSWLDAGGNEVEYEKNDLKITAGINYKF